MLAPEANNIRAALRGVEQEGEGEPGARPDRVLRLECGNVALRPSPISRGFDRNPLNALRGVVGADAMDDAVRHQSAEGVQKIPGGRWGSSLGRDHARDVLALQK